MTFNLTKLFTLIVFNATYRFQKEKMSFLLNAIRRLSGITERNKGKIKYLMNLSFEMRYNEIVKEPQPVEEILQKFLFLTS